MMGHRERLIDGDELDALTRSGGKRLRATILHQARVD